MEKGTKKTRVHVSKKERREGRDSTCLAEKVKENVNTKQKEKERKRKLACLAEKL